MATTDKSNVVPFTQPPSDAGTVYALRDSSLSARRGLETVERIGTPAAKEVLAADAPEIFNPASLSELFIASLDDMIRDSDATRSTTPAWPARRDEQLERVAVDIVSMLFGFVLEDPQLPQGVKASLDRLQLPLLQLAMREPAFFGDWRHPARSLLNDLPRLHHEYRQRGGASQAFEAEFQARLDELLLELHPNAMAFALLNEQLGAFAEEAPIPQGSDDAGAWERAEEAARAVLERGVPELVRDFLADHWIDVLQRTALAHGENSPLWHDCIAVIDDLAWSLAPKADQNERFELIGEIPTLLTRINRGLDLIDASGEERRAFFDALAALHTTLLRIEHDSAKPASHERHESPLEQVNRLQRGDWVEFYRADGSHARNRLTWISPQRGILVFSNHHGQRAIQIAPEALAEQLRTHRAMIIFDQPDVADAKNSA